MPVAGLAQSISREPARGGSLSAHHRRSNAPAVMGGSRFLQFSICVNRTKSHNS
jgi:hypothetical protein